MKWHLLAVAALAVAFTQSAHAGQIMYAKDEALSGQRSFCAMVSDFKGSTGNGRADSFWLAVRFSPGVPYSVRVNGKLVKSDTGDGDNIFVNVTRNGRYRFDVKADAQKFTLALNWFDEAGSVFSIEPTACAK